MIITLIPLIPRTYDTERENNKKVTIATEISAPDSWRCSGKITHYNTGGIQMKLLIIVFSLFVTD